jgi:16S rRNA C967 or C1407 C5-methylase (RsmB/RsmF family)/NOL1/NOP2/fmu family ribosome biogenesis protein
MLPIEFIERIKTQKFIDPDSLIQALDTTAPVSIRINSRKWTEPLLLNDSVPWDNNGFYLPQRPLFTLDPLYHAGAYYPQEASGMFTGEAFRQTGGCDNPMRVLDLCAAPGGKSTHISSLLPEGSFLVANEVIRTRSAILAENVTKWGMGNTIVTQNDPSAFASLPGFFDMIIIDAPCSGEGMFRDATAREEWSPANTQLCCERQRRILMDVWPALKKNGIVIYSTCTFNPAENEQNIEWLIENNKAGSVRLDISRFDGITTLENNGVISYAFYPGKARGEGFFLSVIKKNEGGEFSYAGAKRGKNQSARVDAQIKNMLTGNNENIFLSGNRAIAAACGLKDYETIASALNIIKAGTMLGEVIHGKFIPSHDLAMSTNIDTEKWPVYNATWDEAVDYLRMADFLPREAEPGRILICYRNVPLGFINHLGKRANNGYPQGWRIRMEKRNNFEDII